MIERSQKPFSNHLKHLYAFWFHFISFHFDNSLYSLFQQLAGEDLQDTETPQTLGYHLLVELLLQLKEKKTSVNISIESELVKLREWNCQQ
jgi:hypothetical protein